nr:PREDICTED: facilitated trehalose transporter Tret1-like [Bemisia tabaci]
MLNFIVVSGIERQLAAALISGFSCFIAGALTGWPAPTLKKLREPDSAIRLTPSEEAWVVNALHITTILSTLPLGSLMNTLGRKTTMLVLCVSPIVSWVLVYFARTSFVFIVARSIGGLWLGGCQTLLPIYIAEIAEPRVRGIAGSFIMVNAFAGIIFVFTIGPYVSVPLMAVINAACPCVFFLLFLFCPESPYFYVMRGRYEAAGRALTWLRGGAPIDGELNIIQTSIENEAKEGQGFYKRMLLLITNPANRKAFIIVEVMTFLQRFSGLSVLNSFSTVILPERTGLLTADHCTLIMGIVWLLASMCCSALIDKLGRKPLLHISSIGIFASMIPTAVWYYLDRETSTDVTRVNWVPFAGFLVFGFTVSIGIGPIAAMYPGEMFPSHLKAQASALSNMVSSISATLSTVMFVTINAHIGLYANFFVFAAVGIVNLVFTCFCVIETKGKSLQMIQEKLKHGTWKESGMNRETPETH